MLVEIETEGDRGRDEGLVCWRAGAGGGMWVCQVEEELGT